MRAMPRTWPSIRLKRLAQDALMSLRMRAIYPHRVSVATLEERLMASGLNHSACCSATDHPSAAADDALMHDHSPHPPPRTPPKPQPAPRPAQPGRRDLSLPHASADPAGRPRCLPDLWHGAGAGIGHRRSRAEPRAGGHDAAVLGRARAHASGSRARNGRPPHQSPRAARPELVELAAIRTRHAGGAVGGLAVLRARLAIARHPPPPRDH